MVFAQCPLAERFPMPASVSNSYSFFFSSSSQLSKISDSMFGQKKIFKKSSSRTGYVQSRQCVCMQGDHAARYILMMTAPRLRDKWGTFGASLGG
jgi:hypothetical protein